MMFRFQSPEVEGRWFVDPTPKNFFFFFFFLYCAFIVFSYNKLRAALAMEKTKPIKQNFKHKKPYPIILRSSGK